jgi:hypothetical protein
MRCFLGWRPASLLGSVAITLPGGLRLSSAVLAVLLTVGCNDGTGPGDGDAPTMSDVAGSYQATTLTVEEGGVTTDFLSVGASLEITLSDNGTTAGRLFVPGGDEGGGDLDVDLAGTWALDGTTVTFNQDADTFVRDMDFEYANGQLTGEETFFDATVSVVLAR